MDRYKASSLEAFDTKWPDRYDASPWVRFWVGRWDREVLAALPADVSSLVILDVGCATGRLLMSLAKAGARHLAGIDLAPRIAAVARQRLAEIGAEGDLRVGDAEGSLPWPGESFDVITVTGVLHHFYRPASALREIHRVLRPRGRLIIVDPWFPPPLRQLINCYLRLRPHDGDYRFYSPSEVVRLLASQGFAEPRYKCAVWHSFIVAGVKT